MEELLKALSIGIIHIRFVSVNSGKEIEIPATLQHIGIKQQHTSDKIAVYRVDTKTYEDIVVSSIIDWAPTLVTKWREYG